MNFSQVAGALRPVFTGLVGLAVGKNWISADAIGVIGQVAAFLVSVIGAGGWSAVVNSTSNLVHTVAAVPGVQVKVSSAAAPELVKLASDPTVPDVVHADPVEYPSGVYGTARRRE